MRLNKFERFVFNRDDSEKIQMIADYRQFRNDGFIGGCTLRTVAREWLQIIDDSNVTSTMRDIAMECYRYFAEKYLNNKNNKSI